MKTCSHCGVTTGEEDLDPQGHCSNVERCEKWREQRLEVIAEFEAHGPPETWSLYEDWLHRQKLSRHVEKPPCAVCGGELPYDSGDHLLCSDKCRKKQHASQARESVRRKRSPKKTYAVTCAWVKCSKHFEATRSDARFCSKNCLMKARRNGAP